MSEFTTDTATPVSLPSDNAPAPSSDALRKVDVESNPALNAGRDRALSQLAKTEDIGEYAAERRDQTEHFDKGREVPPEKKAQWYRRASKALADANDADLGITKEFREQIGQSIQQDSSGQVIHDYDRKLGKQQARIESHFGDDLERKQNVVEWGQMADPDGHVANWLIDTESPHVPQILEKLAAEPEAWRQLAEMSPRDREGFLRQYEGYLTAQQQYTKAMAQQQQSFESQRRQTQAPEIIRAPRGGGANPPRNMFDLAAKDNIDSYVKFRKSQKDL